MQAQGLAYSKRVTKTKYQGSLKDFLLASGKQLDIKSKAPKPLKIRKSKATRKRSENAGVLGSKHATLLIRLVKSCSEKMVNKVVTSMTEDQLEMLSQVTESCPLGLTAKVVEKLVEMDMEQFDLVAQAVKSSTEENLANVMQDLLGTLPVKSENFLEEGGESQLDEQNDRDKEIENEPKIFTHSPGKDLTKEIKKTKRARKSDEHNNEQNNVENEPKISTESPPKDLKHRKNCECCPVSQLIVR